MNPTTKILAGLLLIVFLLGIGGYTGYHYTYKYETAKYTAQIDKLNTESANKLNEANAAKTAAETKQATDAAKAKADYDQTITTLNDTVAKLRAEHVVLHDPGVRQSHHSAGSPAAGSTSSSVVSSGSGTAISAGATDFLLGFAQRADTVRAALLECQADDTSVRSAVDSYNTSLQAINSQSSEQAQSAVNKQ